MNFQILTGLLIASPLIADDENNGTSVECGTSGLGQPIESGNHFTEFGLTKDQAKANANSQAATTKAYWQALEMHNANYCEFCIIFDNCKPSVDLHPFGGAAGVADYDAITETWSSGVKLMGDDLAVYLECSLCFD